MRWLLLPLTVVVVAACSKEPVPPPRQPPPPKQDPGPGPWARELAFNKVIDGAMYHTPRHEASAAVPPAFTIVLTKDMPSPGYEVAVEATSRPDGNGVMLARVHEVAPDGAGLTVIDPKQVRFAVGPLRPGEYEMRISLREGDAETARQVQVLTFEAK